MAKDAAPTPPARIDADVDTGAEPIDPAGPGLAARMIAEALGTAVLVAMGLGIGATYGNPLLVAMGFAFAVLGIIITMGHISGAHVNPAVTIGFWIAGRFPGRDVAPYILAQVVGATLGAGVVYALTLTHPAVTASPDAGAAAASTMGKLSIGYGEYSPNGYGVAGAIIGEVIATALLVTVVLAATSKLAPRGNAPYSISLVLMALILFGIPYSNASLNPARAAGSAIFAESWALEQLWVWWLTGLVAGAVIGLLFRAFGPLEDIESTEVYDVEDAS